MKKKDYLVYGIHAVAEAIGAGKDISKVFIRRGLKGELFNELFMKIRESGIPFQYVPVEKINRMIQGNHQGVVALLSLIEYKQVEEIIQRTFEDGRDPLLLLLDQITDVRNFGAMARTAECAGADAIIIPEKGSVTITPDAIKASAGALNRIAVCRSGNLLNTLNYIRNSGIKVMAATEKSDSYYYNADLTGPVAIIMGAEDKGIQPVLLKLCDESIKIPLKGAVQSLNVGVACGVILFEILKQRLEGK